MGNRSGAGSGKVEFARVGPRVSQKLCKGFDA